MFLADIRSTTPAMHQGKCMYTVLYASEGSKETMNPTLPLPGLITITTIERLATRMTDACVFVVQGRRV